MPGWLVATEGKLTVALDITITDDLRAEGIARELINRIQNIRKDSGFEVTDKSAWRSNSKSSSFPRSNLSPTTSPRRRWLSKSKECLLPAANLSWSRR